MSELILIRKSEKAAEMEPAPVKPTIIIGIGGSGGNILLRVRKRFFERYGSLTNFPIVSYLWLDTDSTEKDVGAGMFAEQIRFSLPEKLMTTMNDTTKITSDLNQYPYIKSWFYPGLAKLKTMTEGAGQIRAYSRLGFFEHYEKIKNALIIAGNNVRNVDNSRTVRERHRLDVNPADLQIFVIYSVAGGTGSGMFLDLSFLIKEVFRGEASTVGWVLMPGLFNPNEDRVFANGYAALKEMEHYSYENDFKVEWPDRIPRNLPGPPFNYTYLIDRSNQAKHEVTFANHEITFNMIAENIFKDFTQSDFAGYKRGVRVNLDQYLYDQYAFTHKDERGESLIDQRWITRYSSFGMASITVPADRIELACSYKLAAAVVDHWGNLSDEGHDAALLTDTVLDEVFPAIEIYQGSFEYQGKVEQRHDLEKALLDDRRKSGSMLNLIIQEVEEAAREAREEVYKDQGMSLAQYLRNSVDKIITKLRRRNDPQQSGDYARAIHFNKEEKVVDTQKKLRDEIARLINEHHQSTGYAISLLRQVINVLRDEAREYIPAFARGRDQARKNAEESRSRLDYLLAEISRHEERHNLDLRKGTILRHDIGTFEEIASEYLQNEIMVQVREASREVCESLIAYIGAYETLENDEVRQEGLMGELYTLGSQLVSLKKDLENKHQHFREKPTTSDLSVMLYEPEDIEKTYYPKYLGADKAEHKIVEIGDQILQEFGTTVLNLPRLVRERGIEQIEQQICDLCRTPFQNIKREFDVLELLWKKYPNEADRIAQIRDVYSRAKFWLSGGNRPRSFTLTTERVKILVGVPQQAEPSKLAEFKRLLESKVRGPEDPAISIQSLADRSEIVFYTEVGGIPINWADSISLLREKYNRKQSEGEELHTDSNEIKFQDLVVLDDRERREMEEAHECFLLGLIFGKIKPEKDGSDRIRYLWSEQVGLTGIERPVPLGIEMRALTELINRRSTRESIFRQAQDEVERVRQDRDQLARFNALLGWYYEEVYPETRIQGSDGSEYLELSNLCRAVHKQIAQIQMFLQAQPDFDRQARDEFQNKTRQYRGSLDSFAPRLIDGRRGFQFITAAADARKD